MALKEYVRYCTFKAIPIKNVINHNTNLLNNYNYIYETVQSRS